MTPQLLFEFFKEGVNPPTKPGRNALPPDAQFVRMREDALEGWCDVIVHSNTFPEVSEGAIAEYLPDIQMVSAPKFNLQLWRCKVVSNHFFLIEIEMGYRVSTQLRCPFCISTPNLCTLEGVYGVWYSNGRPELVASDVTA